MEKAKAIEVTEVRLHEHPDIDAICAYWLALRFGQEVFLNLKEAPITFWPQQSMPESAEVLEQKGIVSFDVGEGRFDHHPHGKCLDKCATDLVAEFLNIHEDIALRQILDYVRLQDLEGPKAASRDLKECGAAEEIIQKVGLLETFSLANMSFGNKKPEAYIKAIIKELDKTYFKQLHFWTTVQEEFLEKVVISNLTIVTEEDGSTGFRNIRLALIESDIREVGSFSRTQEGGYCQICVHREAKTGHTFISGQIKSDQFREIAKLLRVLEMQKRGIGETYKLTDLEASWMKVCPIWYLPINIFGEIFIIMNGGQKAQEVEPSVLSLEEIKTAIEIGLNSRILAPDCPKDLCLGRKCQFYAFGLARCQKYQQKEPAKEPESILEKTFALSL